MKKIMPEKYTTKLEERCKEIRRADGKSYIPQSAVREYADSLNLAYSRFSTVVKESIEHVVDRPDIFTQNLKNALYQGLSQVRNESSKLVMEALRAAKDIRREVKDDLKSKLLSSWDSYEPEDVDAPDDLYDW